MNEYMSEAVREAWNGIEKKEGGPFGSVIVKNGEIVGRGHNQVVYLKDPTCHGEVQAIRNACKNLNTFDLSDCVLYTTGEPCPMCLTACMWANIQKIYYGCTIADNAEIGFRDERFYNIIGANEKAIAGYTECIDREECQKLFAEYKKMKKTMY